MDNPRPSTTSNPMLMGTFFLHDTLDLKDISLERDWVGANSTLFILVKTFRDHLRALQAMKRLSSLPQKIFLDVDLTRFQLVIAQAIQRIGYGS
jgi:hypothetical protein